MKTLSHIFVLLVLASCLTGCARRARVLSVNKMAKLYVDMYVSDQWLRDTPEARAAADTTLYFDAIFRRNGCSFADYDKSVNYYLDRPEKYAKITLKAAEILKKLSDESARRRDLYDKIIEGNAKPDGYVPRNFALGRTLAQEEYIWPEDSAAAVPVDTTSVPAIPPMLAFPVVHESPVQVDSLPDATSLVEIDTLSAPVPKVEKEHHIARASDVLDINDSGQGTKLRKQEPSETRRNRYK